METPETIRTSLQIVEWVMISRTLTSIYPFKASPGSTCFHFQGQTYQFTSTTVWSVHSTHGVYSSGKGGQINYITKGYKNPTVPRRLIGQSQIPPNLSPAYTDSSSYMSGFRLIDKHGEIRAEPQHAPHRTVNSHRKTRPPRSTPYEAHTVAPEKQLEGTRITREGNPCAQVVPPSSKVVAGGKQCAPRSTITPTETCSADL